MKKTKSLTPAQVKFMGELLICGNIKQAYTNTKTPKATAYAWVNEPVFRKELDNQKRIMLEDITLKMRAGFSDAIDQLLKIIRKSDTSDQIRINAIDSLFRNTRQLTDEIELRAEMQELKTTLADLMDERGWV